VFPPVGFPINTHTHTHVEHGYGTHMRTKFVTQRYKYEANENYYQMTANAVLFYTKPILLDNTKSSKPETIVYFILVL
jgi:hypothetical protein